MDNVVPKHLPYSKLQNEIIRFIYIYIAFYLLIAFISNICYFMPINCITNMWDFPVWKVCHAAMNLQTTIVPLFVAISYI